MDGRGNPSSEDRSLGMPPELLAPAGDRRCAEAAVAAGADAVYFGLATPSHLNARARAKNIALSELDDLIAWLHRHAVRGYVALNTLVFPSELEEAESILRRVVDSGADAVIVQDFGLARLARAVCPTLPLHASTQMSLSSAEGIAAAESLGIERVILARELSIEEIRTIVRTTTIPVEVFVHGALCVSFSGQCLASRTLGQRSANRGDCAQPCRLPYRVVFDEPEPRPREAKHFAEVAHVADYPLSPKDLAAYDLLPDLVEAGVAAIKIEGRMKTAEYVSVVTAHYRRAIDAAMVGKEPTFSENELRQLEEVFSRGFCHGWLEGPGRRRLATGVAPARRITSSGKTRIAAGTRDRKIPLELVVDAEVGRCLRVSGRTALGTCFELESSQPLVPALKHPLSEALLAEQLGRLGATPYRLAGLRATIVGQPLVPLSVLGELRRAMVAQLEAAFAPPRRTLAAEPQVATLRKAIRRDSQRDGEAQRPRLHVLCRTLHQLQVALACGVRSVFVDFAELADYGRAVSEARKHGAQIGWATPRIQKPHELGAFARAGSRRPDAVLARNLAVLEYFHREGVPTVADFSLNAANELSVQWLRERGACRVTPCHDLNRRQLEQLLDQAPPEWFEIVIHLHIPMFHTQLCLFDDGPGELANQSACRRACRRHIVHLEDRRGVRHPVAADALCRNTVYQAVPQSAAEWVPRLMAKGVRDVRVELLDEAEDRQIRQVIEIYAALLTGGLRGCDAWTSLRALYPEGVTRGTLR